MLSVQDEPFDCIQDVFVVRGDGGIGGIGQQPSSRDARTPHRRPISAGTRRSSAPDTRPLPVGCGRPAGLSRSKSCSVRTGRTGARRPRCGFRGARPSRRYSSVASVYFELSISMRTKKPQRVAGGENFPQVIDADCAIDVQAELRELEREVPLDPGAIDSID